jgi:hypothetical protein
MKSVKDPAALNALALKTGAKVTGEDGKTFNTKQTKAVPEKKLEPVVPLPEPKPEPPPPPEPDPTMVAVGENIIEAGKANVMMLAELKQQISEIKMTATEPVTRWVFTMQRDEKGYLQQIIANGTPEIKVLN